MTIKKLFLSKFILVTLMLLSGYAGWGQTPYVMSGGDYSETFTNIANTTNWPNGFNGLDCAEWGTVAANASGVIGDGVRITNSSATFVTVTTGGLQRGIGNIYLLSTGTALSCAVDLFLDFTGRAAGSVSFDVATVFNGSGDRDSKLKLFYSTDGITWTEITGTNLPYTGRNNVAGSATINVALPSVFNNTSTARLRFYEHSTNTGATPTGSQPKISIDNISVTSTVLASCTSPSTQATFQATAINNISSSSQTINTTRGNGDGGLLVVARAGSAATDPTNGTGYTGNADFSLAPAVGSGKAVYSNTGNGISTNFSLAVTNLAPETRYFYSLYEYNSASTCYNLTENTSDAWTLSTEPGAAPGSLSNTVVAYNQIDLSFSAASTITNADGYIILRRADGTAPTTSGIIDGVAPASWTLPAGTSIATTISSTATTSFSNTGLTGSTNYCYLIIPFNWNGANAQTYNYFTTSTVNTTCGTTPETPSNTSTITTDATYVYTSNINYLTWQSPAISDVTSGAGGSVGVFNFFINDGGGATDADALPTILNALTFTYTGTANTIRTAALFTTANVLVANAANIGANSIGFTGLSGANVTATDNGNAELILRVTFNTTVTDNEKLVFTISSSAVAASGSSAFAAANAGGAFSDNNSANDNNRIEVAADRLRFTTQPVDQATNTNLATFSLAARDVNNNTDLDAAFGVSLTTSGTGMTASSPYSLTNGVLNISNVQFSTVQAGISITATTTGLSVDNDDVSSLFNISNVANGSYRTTGNGASWATATWERFNSGWAISAPPVSGNVTDLIYIRHSVPFTGSMSYGKITIENGGLLTVPASSTITTLLVKDGGVLQINANLTIAAAGTFTVEDNGTVNINFAYGTPSSSIWNGTEVFAPNSNFVFQDWDCANDVLLDPAISTNTYNGYIAAFGNIKIDFQSNLTVSDDWIMIPSGSTTNLAHGDLWFFSNDTYVPGPPIARPDMRISTTGTVTSGIGGDFIVDNNYDGRQVINFKTSGTLTFTIKGNMQLDAATTSILASSVAGSSSTVNIEGDLNISSSAVLDFNPSVAGGSPAPLATINLRGDLNGIGNGCLLRNSNTSNPGIFNFSGTGNGTTTALTQTIDVASTSSSAQNNISFFVKSGAYVQLANRDFQIGNSGTFTVEGGGILDFGYNGISGWIIKERTSSPPPALATTVFTLNQLGTIKITHENGIVTTPTANGNVQLDTRIFNEAATYHYIGKQNQFTGNALPYGATSSGALSGAKVVICDMFESNLSLTPSAIIALSDNTTVSNTYGGHLYIKNGAFTETTGEYFVQCTGTLRMEPGTLYYIPRGQSSANSSNGDVLPRLAGSIANRYYLTGGTIEFASTGSFPFQTLRGNRTYANLKFSGANSYGNDYKFLSSNATVDSAVIITGNCVVDCRDLIGESTDFTGNGGLIMTGGILRLRTLNSTGQTPRLTATNTGTTYSLTGGTIEFYGTGATQQQSVRASYGSPSVKINYNHIDVNAIAANYSAPSTAGNVNVSASIVVNGNLIVYSPAVFRLDPTDNVSGPGNIEIKPNAGFLYGSANGIKTSGTGNNDGNIRLSGPTRTFSTEAIYGFVGGNNMVTGNGLPATVKGLFILKTDSTNLVTLSNPVSIDSILNLNRGLPTTSLTNLLTLNVNAGSTAGRDASFVNGPMKKIGTTNFTFPVGKPIVSNYAYNPEGNGGWRPIGVSNLGAISTDAYTAEFFLYSATEIGPVTSPGLLRVSPCEYWGLKRESSASQNINVTLYWKPKSDCNPGFYIVNPAGVTAALSSTGAPLVYNKNNPWDYHGGMGSGTSNDGFVIYPNVDFNLLNTPFALDVTYKDFTPFAIGSTNISQAPLPFDIKHFKAIGKGKTVQLDWLINHNDEVRSYVIERSRDGIHFDNMKMVPARANEETAAYADIDLTPYNGWGYYRLRISDLTGRVSYSNIQKVWMGNTGTYVQVTPKPAKDRLWINLAEPEKISEMVIVNSVGQLLFKQNRFTNNNQIDISSFRPGVYYVRIVGQNGIVTEPFVKE